MSTSLHHCLAPARPHLRMALLLMALAAPSACSSVAPPNEAAQPSSPIARAWRDGNQKGMQQLADSELRDMRGGLNIAGLDLSITAEVATLASDGVALITQLTVDDAGKLQVVASESQTVAQQALATIASARGTASAPATTVNVTQSGGSSAPTPSPDPSTGGTSFVASAGNSATTEVTHEIINNSISTVVSNRVNNATIDQVTALNIAVRNFAMQELLAAQVNNLAHANALSTDIARFH